MARTRQRERPERADDIRQRRPGETMRGRTSGTYGNPSMDGSNALYYLGTWVGAHESINNMHQDSLPKQKEKKEKKRKETNLLDPH